MIEINKITCPHCEKDFELKKAILKDLESDLRVKLKKEFDIDKYKEMKNVKNQLDEKHLRDKEIAIENIKKSLSNDLSEKNDHISLLQAEKDNLIKEKNLFEKEFSRKVDARVKNELLYHKETSDIETHKLIINHEKEVENLHKRINDLSRIANQNSLQRQGDAGEIFINKTLEKNFPDLEVMPIKKGENGGDCILHYRKGSSHYMIKYESKRTKSYDRKWEKKINDDMKKRGAMYGLIVTEAMPSDKNFPHTINGKIWICSFNDFLKITQILIELFNEIHKRDQAQRTTDSDARKMLNHLTSPEFAASVNSLIKTHYEMKDHLTKEENALKRSITLKKHLNDKIYESIMEMYTGLETVAKNNMPKIKGLSDLSDLKKIN